jgi:predicted nucleic acid-binding protein
MSWTGRRTLSDIICNTSPLQYLHQIGQLALLVRLAPQPVIVPTAVAAELAAGRRLGLDLPVPEDLAWIHLRKPASESVLRLATDLGPGETAVLALALESRDPVVILDNALARRYADVLGLPLTEPLGCCSMPSVPASSLL